MPKTNFKPDIKQVLHRLVTSGEFDVYGQHVELGPHQYCYRLVDNNNNATLSLSIDPLAVYQVMGVNPDGFLLLRQVTK